MNQGTIKVLLVDDHAIWRRGVCSMLEDTEFTVIGEASSGKEALIKVNDLLPDLVLLDIRMDGGDGLEALVALKKQNPRVAVIMLSTYDNPTYVARAVAGGAAAYITKGTDREEILTVMRAVSNNEMTLSPDQLLSSLQGIHEQAGHPNDAIVPLTRREHEVVKLLSTGLNNHDIALLLGIAESTIKAHVEHIIGKIGVSDRVQAAVWAVRQGLIQQEENVRR